MKVGDLVKFESDQAYASVGIVVKKRPERGISAASVDILWHHGELSERCPPRVLEVISESR